MRSSKKIDKQQLLKVITELQQRPDDRGRILGEVGITAVGAGLGAAAAGTVATVAGVTSIPILTSAASWLGVTAVAATPVGWLLGVAAAGGALAYGVTRLIRSGSIAEGRKKELLLVYQERLRDARLKERSAQITPRDRNQFISALRELIEKDAIQPQKAFQLIEAVERGAMPVSEAYTLISAVLRGS